MRPVKSHQISSVVSLADFKPLFPVGKVVATPEALKTIDFAGQSPIYFLARHASGDWVESGTDNEVLNKKALADGGQIFSMFETDFTDPLYVITEGDRSLTTIVLAKEY